MDSNITSRQFNFLCKKLQNMENSLLYDRSYTLVIVCGMSLLSKLKNIKCRPLFYSCVCLWTRIALQHYVVSSCQNNEKFFPYFFSLFFRIGWMMNWRLSALFALQSHPFIQYNTIHGFLFFLKLKRRMVIYLKTYIKKICIIRIVIKKIHFLT